MKGAVIVGRIVTVITVFHHLIDEPTVDAFVEMRRFDPKEENAQQGTQDDD